MADTLSTLSIIAYILAGVFLLTAIVLFFALKIPKVLDYFTNRSAKKSIRQMTVGGAGAKNASFQTDQVNRERGKITEPVEARGSEQTTPLSKNAPILRGNAPNGHSQESARREEQNVTAFLDPAAERQAELSAATEELDTEYATEILPQTVAKVAESRPRVEMTKLDEVFLIHTQEVI